MVLLLGEELKIHCGMVPKDPLARIQGALEEREEEGRAPGVLWVEGRKLIDRMTPMGYS